MARRFSLTTSMLLMTVIVGLAIWVGYDAYQYRAMNTVLRDSLTQRFDLQAKEQRLRFDNYVKSFNPAVKLYTENTSLHKYLRGLDWNKPAASIIEYEKIPPWMPSLSLLRRFILPRYAMLLDDAGKVREMYHVKGTEPPDDLINISGHALELSDGQGYMMMKNGSPYMVTSELLNSGSITARLLIASPVDGDFLRASQGASSHGGVIALLKEGENKILVSNNEDLVPAGTLLSELEKSYLQAGEGFFSSGSSDIIIQFVSLVSLDEVQTQTEAILYKDRQVRAITAITFILAFGFAMYWITSRIQNLSRKVAEFSNEMHMPQPDMYYKDEIEELESRFELLAQAVQFETSALEHETLHDLLTGLPNRKLLYDRLQAEVINCEKNNGVFVLMLCDLNGFKEVNDTLGHHVGDLILKLASERLQVSLRKDDTVARFGGDEFCLLLTKASVSEAKIIADKITEAFNSPFAVDGNIVKVGISIGIVEYPEHGATVDVLMKRADVAMYHAKNNKTGYTIYNALINGSNNIEQGASRNLKT